MNCPNCFSANTTEKSRTQHLLKYYRTYVCNECAFVFETQGDESGKKQEVIEVNTDDLSTVRTKRLRRILIMALSTDAIFRDFDESRYIADILRSRKC